MKKKILLFVSAFMMISLFSIMSCDSDEIDDVIQASTLICYECSENGSAPYTTCESSCTEGSNCKADLELLGYVCTLK